MEYKGEARESSAGTVLVVDDEAIVLRVMRGILANQGYRVLAAGGANEALEIFRREPHIDLLLTDVVMPGINGPELAEALLLFDPGLRVLFTAGMPDTPLIRKGVLERGFELIPKPFLPCELAAKVREVLVTPRVCAAGMR
jgi:two-component system cell cycle sensor histidine kinase/response regulator CckA